MDKVKSDGLDNYVKRINKAVRLTDAEAYADMGDHEDVRTILKELTKKEKTPESVSSPPKPVEGWSPYNNITHEVPCNDCGSKEWPDWILPNEEFNKVCPGGNGYLCLTCFVNRATKKAEVRGRIDEVKKIIKQCEKNKPVFISGEWWEIIDGDFLLDRKNKLQSNLGEEKE